MAWRQDRDTPHTVAPDFDLGFVDSSSAMPMSKLSLGRSWLTTSEWREIIRTATPGRSQRKPRPARQQ
jgi:hypothetical protein